MKPGMLIFTMKLAFNLVSDMAIIVGFTSVIRKKSFSSVVFKRQSADR